MSRDATLNMRAPVQLNQAMHTGHACLGEVIESLGGPQLEI